MAEHKDHYSHYCNHKCEYFPCHKVPEGFDFNCLFCYCPLYALGDKCGGNFKWGLGGLKDCSECLVPHGPNGYEHVMTKIPLLIDMTRKQED